MAESPSPKKVVTLDSMKVLVDKIKADFATKEAVTQQIKEAGGVGLSDASEAEILALFDDPPRSGGHRGNHLKRRPRGARCSRESCPSYTSRKTFYGGLPL